MASSKRRVPPSSISPASQVKKRSAAAAANKPTNKVRYGSGSNLTVTPLHDPLIKPLPQQVPPSLPRTDNRCGCPSADKRVLPDHLQASCVAAERKSAGIPVRLHTPAPRLHGEGAHV